MKTIHLLFRVAVALAFTLSPLHAAAPPGVLNHQGHYALGLGDTALANMTASIPASVFTGKSQTPGGKTHSKGLTHFPFSA